MSDKTAEPLQRLLQPTEQCEIAVSARMIKKDGRRTACLVGIVRSTTAPQEPGLFIMKTGRVFAKAQLYRCMPISATLVFDATQAPTEIFTVGHRDESFVFESSHTEHIRIVTEITKAKSASTSTPNTNNTNSTNSTNSTNNTSVVNSSPHSSTETAKKSHAWLQAYEVKDKKHRGATTFYTDASAMLSTTSPDLPRQRNQINDDRATTTNPDAPDPRHLTILQSTNLDSLTHVGPTSPRLHPTTSSNSNSTNNTNSNNNNNTTTNANNVVVAGVINHPMINPSSSPSLALASSPSFGAKKGGVTRPASMGGGGGNSSTTNFPSLSLPHSSPLSVAVASGTNATNFSLNSGNSGSNSLSGGNLGQISQNLSLPLSNFDKQPVTSDDDADDDTDYGPLTTRGDKYNPYQFLHYREVTINRLLKKREAEYTVQSEIQVKICSWNVNGKQQGSASLTPWLDPGSYADIVVVGLQEFVDLNAQNLILTDNARAQEWEKLIISSLNGKYNYVLVSKRQLVGLFIGVFVREDHSANVSAVRGDSIGCGIGGWMGNKGGVGVRLQLYDSTICFVNSHLDADKEKVDGRNADMKDISARMMFRPHEGDDTVSGISDHDFVFWFGDLNYRISLPYDEVLSRIRNQDLPYLLSYDQLNVERQALHCFEGFEEASISFAPTYKYDVGSSLYSSGERKRTPAWCDRVLWSGNGIKCVSYGRAELKTSDHRPIYCHLSVPIRKTIVDKRQEVYASIVRELDKIENDIIPDVKVHCNLLHFESVHFNQPLIQHTMIENVGRTLVQFFFIPKLDAAQFCKPWLSITPRFGMILPGESVPINMRIHVTPQTAWALNSGDDKLDDVLVLHLENGRDFFIQVTGDFKPSCFGNSLSALVCMAEPVRQCSLPISTENSSRCLSIPKELWRMCDFLHSRALETEEGLFQRSVTEKELSVVREALDTGEQIPESCTVHTIAESIVRFLDSLRESVIPCIFFADVMLHYANAEMAKQIVMDLDPVHYNVFVYLMSFLREMTSKCPDLSAKLLAEVFADVLLRPESTGTNATPLQQTATLEGSSNNNSCGQQQRRGWSGQVDPVSSRKCSLFLLHFLVDEDSALGSS